MINLSLRCSNGEVIPLEQEKQLLLEEKAVYEIISESSSVFECFFDGVKLEPNEQGYLTIRPGFWVADSVLHLKCADQLVIFPIRVQPSQEKLSDALWVAMVSDLENWLSGLSAGIEGGRSGSVGNEGVPLPFITEALTPLLVSLERALQVLIDHPRQRDISIQEDVPLRMVRKVDRETLNWISRHPHLQDHMDPWKVLELHGEPPLVPQRLTFETNDHPANRYISWLVRRVESYLYSAEEGLLRAASSKNISEESGLWCRSRAERLRDAANHISKLWRRSFLFEVQREPLSEAALQVIIDDPTYLRVHQIGRLFLNPLFKLDKTDGAHQAAVRPSYSVYELWAFLAVFQLLKDCLPGWVWKTCGIKVLLDPCSTGSGALFQAKNAVGDVLKIRFNAKFIGYFSRSNKKRWSISGERRPDIVLSYKPSSGDGRWLCLDAKYRVGRTNLGDAYSSVHIYKDALRYDGYGGKSQAVLLLSPSKTEDAAGWFSKEYIQEFGAGIWEVKPGFVSPQLGSWIIATLGVRG